MDHTLNASDQTIHPTVFRFSFFFGWNSLSAGSVKQIVFQQKPSKKVFPNPSKGRCFGGNSVDLWPGGDGMFGVSSLDGCRDITYLQEL